MTRITKEMAKRVADRIAGDQYGTLIEQWHDKLKVLVNEHVHKNCYTVETFDEELLPYLKKTQTLDIDVRSCHSSEENYYIGGRVIYMSSNSIVMDTEKTFLFEYNTNGNLKYIRNGLMCDVANSLKDLIVEYNDFRKLIMTQVRAFGTVKRLITSYPEIESFVRDLIPNKTTLPAAKLDDRIVRAIATKRSKK